MWVDITGLMLLHDKQNILNVFSHQLRHYWDIQEHHDDVIMTTMASEITSLTIVYSIVYSDADQRKHQSSASLAFVRGIHRGPVNSPHKWPVRRKCFHLITSSWIETYDIHCWRIFSVWGINWKFCVDDIFLYEMVSAFVRWCRGFFSFNPNMQNSA